MTPDCVATVVRLEGKFHETEFGELSGEQLLLAAISGTSIDDVENLLKETDWNKWLEIKKQMERADE